MENIVHLLHRFIATQWLFKKGFPQGAFWACMVSLSSVFNDVIMCGVGKNIPVIEITFLRFFFSTLILLPFVFYVGFKTFKTNMKTMHLIRIILGAFALWLGCLAVNHIDLSQNTAITFTQPLFFLPLAYFFLKERVGYPRIFATVLGFLGLIYLLQPGTNTFSYYSCAPILAAFLFAILDVLTKKMVSTESTLLLLFSLSFGSMILVLPFAWGNLEPISLYDTVLLIVLGLSANLIQVFLFLAFKATDVSALGPFKYTELLFAILFGYIFFGQVPHYSIFIGSTIIIASTLYISYIETQKKTKTYLL